MAAERVRNEHKVAWLLEAAALGELELRQSGDDEIELLRGNAQPRPAARNALERIFSSGDRVELGEYDAKFATAWEDLGSDLDRWKDRSGFWDPAGDERRTAALLGGSVLAAVGLALVLVTAGFAMRWSLLWLLLVIPSGLVFGAAITTLVRSWELRVRTPEGTDKWLEVEALRRFLSELEPESALNMIEPDRFAGYTAWAVTFGLDDRWKAISDRLRTDPRFARLPDHHFHMAAISPSVSRSVAVASTAPSSSGGGGGGVGGGGGGGGGGSW